MPRFRKAGGRRFSVGISECGIAGTFGVGHHAKDILCPVRYPGDIMQCAIGVAVCGNLPMCIE